MVAKTDKKIKNSDAAILAKIASHAKTNFRSFIHFLWPQSEEQTYVISDVHEYLIQLVQDTIDGKVNPHQIVSLSPQHGKQASYNTSILTTKGIKKHGEIEIGDEVYHLSGKPIKVVGTIPQTEPCSMEVWLSNGEKIKVHPNHEWTVISGGKVVTLETKQMLQQGIVASGVKGKRRCRYRFQLPEFNGTEGVRVRLPIDPYWLGVWLGDGASEKLTIGTPDNEIFENLPYKVSSTHTHKTTGLKYWCFGGNGLLQKLKLLKVFNNKHIPWQYLVTTRENRLELLAGLIDTDGSLSKKTGQYRFINTNKQLIEGVQVLLSSLGYTSSITVTDPALSSSGIQGNLPVYYIGFTPTEIIPCRVPRKQSTKTVLRRKVAVVDIRELPVEEHEEGKCLTVDSEDGLYMIGKRMVPTHNSRLLSVRAVAWLIGAKPGIHLAMTGFSTSLLITFVAEAKAIIASSRYKLVFGNVEPVEGRDKANDVTFNNESNIQARSCGSKLTGRRVDWLIVDDPHAGREEAESPTQRKKISQWFFADCISRISNNAKIFIVATRWHPEDLIGSLTGEEGKKTLIDAGYEKWTFNHINLPAIAEDNDPIGRKYGEPLFPEQRPLEYLLGIKALMPAYEWESQYMGRPRAASGEQVDVSNIQMISITEVPMEAEWVIGWDLAITEKQSADYTAGVLCAMKHEWIESTEWSESEKRMVPKRKKVEYFYIIEAVKAQKAWAQMRKMVLDNCRRVRSVYGVGRAGIEAVSGFDAVYQDVKQELMGEMLVQKAPAPKGGKLMRAQMWLNLIQAKRVFMVKGLWNSNYLTELSMFPQGHHDDQVDATSVCYQMLSKKQGKLMLA